MTKHIFSFLALGDSYTIGEAVPIYESFPYQTVQLLRAAGLHFYAPEIVAKTGWTTFELAEHILHSKLNEHYDFVTLLIGVNNQFRGLSTEDYTTDFEFLLHKAIHFADEKNDRVIVLSIPDYGVTPFAKKMEPCYDITIKKSTGMCELTHIFDRLNRITSGVFETSYSVQAILDGSCFSKSETPTCLTLTAGSILE